MVWIVYWNYNKCQHTVMDIKTHAIWGTMVTYNILKQSRLIQGSFFKPR